MSLTITVAEQLAWLPKLSVTVRVTELLPRLEQLNCEGLTDLEAIPLGELDPLSMLPGKSVASPLPLRYSVKF